MAQKIQGSDLMLFIGSKSIALATNHTLEISGDTQSTSNKDEGAGGWASEEVSLLHWSGTTENLFTPDGEGNLYNDLFDMMVAKTPVAATFTLKKETATTVPTGGWTPIDSTSQDAMKDNIYTGNIAITSLSINAPHGEYATYTMNFTGVGALTRVQ